MKEQIMRLAKLYEQPNTEEVVERQELVLLALLKQKYERKRPQEDYWDGGFGVPP